VTAVRRTVVAVTAGLLVAVAPAGTASADPAGPTDFRTSVVAVTPTTDSIDVAVIGGDSFLQLTVTPGHDVVVLGYQQEPYLHFRADGIVEENERSPTTYLNADRYGGGEVPAGADASLPPNWRQVASAGRYAWHDHRAHWMDRNPPTAGVRGAPVQSATVPLRVDGVPVEVAVRTDWLPEPSRVPLAVGTAVALALVLLALLLRRRIAWALLVASAAATGIGWWQYGSLPSETGPLLVWWLLPALATVSVVVALALGWRLLSFALVLLASLQLALWVFVRRDGAFRAIIPTDAPYWLDRGVMAGAAVVAVVAAVGAAVTMFRAP
jgi:hypothetical protein